MATIELLFMSLIKEVKMETKVVSLLTASSASLLIPLRSSAFRLRTK